MYGLRISFCTTCMDRLHHLRKTLPKNIIDNIDYKNLEFVIVDYNSSDDLECFIREKMNQAIKTGQLKYYKILTPKYYNRSHARNLAFRLATGDIICNIDADNFTGKGFASFINEAFTKQSNCFLNTHDLALGKGDILGRICVKKEDFMYIRGYDEKMKHYGFEDFDFVNRLKMIGLRSESIKHTEFLNAITHSDQERIINGPDDQKFQSLLVRYLTPSSSDLLYLFNNNKFKRGIMVKNPVYHIINNEPILNKNKKHRLSILNDSWYKGKWYKVENSIWLTKNKRKEELRLIDNGSYELYQNSNELQKFNEVKNQSLKTEALFFYNQISNNLIMEDNLLQKKAVVNKGGFGTGIVFKNFDYQNPIVI